MKDTELEEVTKNKFTKDRMFAIDTTFVVQEEKGQKLPNDFDSIRGNFVGKAEKGEESKLGGKSRKEDGKYL